MYADIRIGDTATYTKTVTEKDVLAFAEITGDVNPVHVDPQFAAASLFKERIAHGFLTGSLISTILGTILPGPNTLYLRQEMNFKAPVKFGETITAEVKVIEKKDDKKILKLETIVRNQDGTVVLDGIALVKKYEK